MTAVPRTLILDGSSAGDERGQRAAAALHDLLRGEEVEVVPLRDREVAPCRGCFGCWIRTPGECVIDDFGRELARLYIGSRSVVFLSPVTFGGYSAGLKKGLDRMIGLVHGLFCERDGLTRHPPRYPAYPAILGVGLLAVSDPEAEDLFRRLVEKNALNLYAPDWGTVFLCGQPSPDGAVSTLAPAVGALRARRAEEEPS